MTITLDQLTLQNTPNNGATSEGFPLGVPHGYSWYVGDDGLGGAAPPASFTSMTGWAVVYPEEGSPTTALRATWCSTPISCPRPEMHRETGRCS